MSNIPRLGKEAVTKTVPMKTWKVFILIWQRNYSPAKWEKFSLNTFIHVYPYAVTGSQTSWDQTMPIVISRWTNPIKICCLHLIRGVETHSPHERAFQPLAPAWSSLHLPPSHTPERSSHWEPSHGSGGRYQCALELAPPCDQSLTAAWICLHKDLDTSQLSMSLSIKVTS